MKLKPVAEVKWVFTCLEGDFELFELDGQLPHHYELQHCHVELFRIAEDPVNYPKQEPHPVYLNVDLPLHSGYAEVVLFLCAVGRGRLHELAEYVDHSSRIPLC